MTERTKSYMGIAVIVALLAFSFAVVSYARSFSRSIDPGSLRSFSVSAEGKVVAIPDVAAFSFGVITEGGPDIAALQRENAEKVNSAIAFVKSQGIDAKDIKTEQFNLEPRYQYFSCPRAGGSCPPPTIVGYTVTEQVAVKVRDFTKIGVLLAGVLENGANTASQLRFTIDDPTEVEQQARKEAIEKAQAKARAIASAGGFGLGKLISISEGSGGIPIYEKFGRGGDASLVAESLPPVIEAGSEEVRIQVSLIYEIR